MSRLKGVATFFGGVVLLVLGIGMYHDPQIDWEGFLGAWVWVARDIDRLADDPFAVLGIAVLVIGIFVAVGGIKRVVRG